MPALRSLASLLAPERIRVGLAASSKDEVLQAVVDLTATDAAVHDAAHLLDDVRAREAMLSTGVGEGLALPHARTAAVSESLAAFVTLQAPIEFGAIDGQPVGLVLFLAGPEADRVAHLHVLGRVSRILSDADVRAQLAAAATPEKVLAILQETEAALA